MILAPSPDPKDQAILLPVWAKGIAVETRWCREPVRAFTCTVCAQKVHLGTVGDFCPKWEPAFGATAESAGAWYLLGSYLAGISLAKLRKKTVARGY